MKMNVSTQTLLSEEVIDLLLKNYIVTTGQSQIKDLFADFLPQLIKKDKTIAQTSNVQKKEIIQSEYISKIPSDVVIKISKYLTTCKKLYSNINSSSIWYNFLKRDYLEEFNAIDNPVDLYDIYRYFDTNTLYAKNLSIAEMGKNWKLEGDGAVLTDVCWFDVNGEFKYVTNGNYIVKCVVKIENVSGGLVGLDFIARFEGAEEQYKYSLSKVNN
ncbi:hypothetical protein H8356DRAFT_1340701 [Neocallimastix lanati (nom. inval.)]|nr:hypothetical protein H8356DRAFT_1340701 [Neocallimastix sp. JGI-2020a]